MENNEIKRAEIDKDVLDTMIKSDEEINAVLDNDIACKRLILNCFCELLSELQKLHKDIDDLNTTLSICGADKLTAYFKEIQKNFDSEVVRANVKKKVSKSHQKKKTTTKK